MALERIHDLFSLLKTEYVPASDIRVGDIIECGDVDDVMQVANIQPYDGDMLLILDSYDNGGARGKFTQIKRVCHDCLR